MFGSSMLDVAIGMALIYLVLSLIASAIQEGIAAFAQSRPANLLKGVQSLFSGDNGPDGKSLVASLYDHGLIRGLYRDLTRDSGKKSALRPLDRFKMLVQKLLGLDAGTAGSAVANPILLPAYIPSRTFALAMIDILSPADGGAGVTLEGLRKVLSAALAEESNKNNKALEAISALADSAGDDIKVFQKRLEDWYNDAMDRISGWYKKHTQNLLLLIGLALAIAFNVNSIVVAKTLWTDKDARETLVAQAKQYLDSKKGEAAHPAAQGGATGAQGSADAQQPNAAGQSGADAKPQLLTGDFKTDLEGSIGQFQQIEDKKLLPLGWNEPLYSDTDTGTERTWKVFLSIVGWLITALALSLGASFWFDTLNKFMVIRGTIKPDEKSQPEPSKG
ncbi:MAG TPA: hypothetical protein VKB38_24880 [Terracidiphilus sp.]|nr:hypothetical protein [Terracidiphilus sp.]